MENDGTNKIEEFSICDSCLGSNKYVKMIKQSNGSECKSCTRPFTVYRWNSDKASNKSKKTIICMTCARSKNCCQTCMMDIHYNIPIEIRDTALRMAGIERAPLTISKNREVKAIMADKQEESFKTQDTPHDQQELAREILSKLSAKLNDSANTISFKKASKNPKNSDNILKNSDIKSTDISKILSKLPFGGLLDPQLHPNMTTLFMFGIAPELPQYVIVDYLNTFGKVKTFTLVHKARCAFVTFVTREGAVALAESILNNGLNHNKSTAGLVIFDKKYPVRVSWGIPKSLGTTNDEHHKLNLVVAKVMKQLAEKDREVDDNKLKQNKSSKKSTSTPASSSSTTKSTKTTKKSKTAPKNTQVQTSQPSYLAAKSDFEL